MEHRIIEAKARPDFRIDIEWEGGSRSTVDLTDFVSDGEVTAALRDPVFFSETLEVQGSGDWIAWPNGVDMDADALWYLAHPDEWSRDHHADLENVPGSRRS
ncbi:MAG: DUF2442 domain-containing protein [Alphaproteobacteria bacterium]|jgi:hypothetical protein|nr:DUF2442 domain-containing protein [Alphaproteobacteria bacterium]